MTPPRPSAAANHPPHSGSSRAAGRAARSLQKRVGDHVGERIRRRRTELGLTQEQLGAALGISYQQIQKYETGANRVSAARLYELAQAFDVDVAFFFEGLDHTDTARALPHGEHSRASIDLVRNFMALKDDSLRMAVSGLVKALRDRDGVVSQADTTAS
jgi:transcriptional regulator with XRE-family HTH domain